MLTCQWTSTITMATGSKIIPVIIAGAYHTVVDEMIVEPVALFTKFSISNGDFQFT